MAAVVGVEHSGIEITAVKVIPKRSSKTQVARRACKHACVGSVTLLMQGKRGKRPV